MVAAHEDLGALLWAIKNRTSTRRVVQNYLRYAPGAVSTIYKQLDEMSSVVELLSLPKLREDGDRESVSHSIEELTPALAFAAQNYAALDGRLVRGYNKMKHGFVLIQRVDQIAPNRPLHNDWQNQVHIALGWDRLGIDYLSIDRSEGTMSDTIGAIKMCYLCWKELAGLTILLGDRGVLYAAS